MKLVLAAAVIGTIFSGTALAQSPAALAQLQHTNVLVSAGQVGVPFDNSRAENSVVVPVQEPGTELKNGTMIVKVENRRSWRTFPPEHCYGRREDVCYPQNSQTVYGVETLTTYKIVNRAKYVRSEARRGGRYGALGGLLLGLISLTVLPVGLALATAAGTAAIGAGVGAELYKRSARNKPDEFTEESFIPDYDQRP